MDKKKLGALVNQNAQKKKGPPPKKPGGPPPKQQAQQHQEEEDEEPHEHDEEGKDVDVHEIGERVQSGDGDEQLMDLTKDYDPDQGDPNPPDWVDDEDTWEKAKKAVEPYEDNYDNKWAVVAHVYKEMGGGVSGGD